MSESKKELRNQMETLCRGLDPRWVRAASLRVCGKIHEFLSDYPDIKNILAWASHFPGEIELTRLLSDEMSERTIYLPRIDDNSAMTFLSISENWESGLTPGKFGIGEPTQKMGIPFETSLSRSTAVLVPGLAFDHKGRRLGRGKSFYDRFLSQAKMLPALKIGICWDLQIVDRVPTEDWDIPMDVLVTEEGIIRIGDE